MAKQIRGVHHRSQCAVWRRNGHLEVIGVDEQGDWAMWLSDEQAIALAMMIVDAYIEELAAAAEE